MSGLQSASYVDVWVNTFSVNSPINFFSQTLNVHLAFALYGCYICVGTVSVFIFLSDSFLLSLRSHQNRPKSQPILLEFCPLHHLSLRIAYTATAIKQVLYCCFLWRFSWLLTLISLRREENGICSYSLKHPHIPIFKENKWNWILKLRTGRFWQLSEEKLSQRQSLSSSLRLALRYIYNFTVGYSMDVEELISQSQQRGFIM